MNGNTATGLDPSGVGARHNLYVAVAFLLGLFATNVFAWEPVPSAPVPLSTLTAADQRITPAQLEVSAAAVPRFENVDGSTQNSRIALTWLPPRRPGMGLAMGMTLGMTNRTAPGFFAGAPFLGTSSSVDLGFHWRYTLDSQYRIDLTAWHRMAPTDAIDLVQSREPAYGARVEMGLRPLPRRGLIADRGFVGVQLDGGARITVRRSGGKPMLYYRATF